MRRAILVCVSVCRRVLTIHLYLYRTYTKLNKSCLKSGLGYLRFTDDDTDENRPTPLSYGMCLCVQMCFDYTRSCLKSGLDYPRFTDQNRLDTTF